jgi:hypothetical protein
MAANTRMSTPWGTSQGTRCIAPGVISVHTAGHGGIGITRNKADAMGLHPAARAIAINDGQRYWFEEDCHWAVAAWELGPAHWPALFPVAGQAYDPATETASIWTGTNPDRSERRERLSVREYLRSTISTWNPEYLQARGEQLDQASYQHWLDMRECERLRREKSPDFIISALRMDDERTKVATADGLYHVITADSYADRNGRLNRLSACVVLESGTGGFY